MELEIKPSSDEVLRIAIVDDDADEGILFTEKLLELKLAHVIYTAYSCGGLLTVLEQNPLPHIIFMDVNMPLPNGHECVKNLKAHERYAHIPVVMYSISSSPEDIETAYAAGAHYYVVKPYSPTNLGPTLKRVFRHDWRKPPPVPGREEFVINVSY